MSTQVQDVIRNGQSTETPLLLQVIKRDQHKVVYESARITNAIARAFISVISKESIDVDSEVASRIQQTAQILANSITKNFSKRWPEGGAIHIEAIQDQVELTLMHAEKILYDLSDNQTNRHAWTSDQYFKVFKAYVVYRQNRQVVRQAEQTEEPTLLMESPLGHMEAYTQKRLEQIIAPCCQGIDAVDANHVAEDAFRNLFAKATLKDIYHAMIMSAKSMVENEPNYTYVAANLLSRQLMHEVCGFYGIAIRDHEENYRECFKAFIHHGIQSGTLDQALGHFDLNALAQALQVENDGKINHHGLQTLYDRYFLHEEGVRMELPQIFFMRVAMGQCLHETYKEKRAIDLYRLYSSLNYMSSTPTLFNSGTNYPQLSSCFLTTISDDLSTIFKSVHDNALLSKYAGGIGNDWTPVRALGAHIKGTNGQSLGVVPFMKVADSTAGAVNQGGKRKGAVVAYLENWHLDIEEFLELRKNTGDDRRRTHDMNTAVWIPDLFMQRLDEDGQWTLFSPSDVPDLHDLYGQPFKTRYEQYEALAAQGAIRSKTMSAKVLWRKMLSMVYETGHPWLTFKDPCNLRSPQRHDGVVHSSNLCTEITLNTNEEEIAVCNLGSINVVAHIKENGAIDHEKLKETIRVAVRALDNVIDLNYYTVPQAKRSNLKHRPVGLGMMGFQDALLKKKMAYASEEAVNFADELMEAISYYAIEASSDLAKERGAYKSYKGSLWSQGILPIDSIQYVKEVRTKEQLTQDTSGRMDWSVLREKIDQQGMRNSNVLAIAPTATISNICGISQSIEPSYQNLYVKSNMSGEFTVINTYLVDELKALGLWDAIMVNDLKCANGSVQNITRIPEEIRKRYATAFEVDPSWLIEAASRRQKWLDQSQSLNLYFAQPSGATLSKTYRHAWRAGLKCTYYARTLGATDIEKSTVNHHALNAVSPAKACSIDDPDCEACQ